MVIVPEKEMYYYGFNGTEYIILNPDTGEVEAELIERSSILIALLPELLMTCR